ncbi:MAG: toll/interleukin-1 receptor domain-containing protein [Limisphaerales bacterium]
MANPEHLAILKQGVEAWNKWREENRKNPSHQRRARVGNARLRKTNLLLAELRGAHITAGELFDECLLAADLSGAKLTGAPLNGADLSEVSLWGANLFSAQLIGSNLRGASLIGASLMYADLSGADLSSANLSRADLRCAILRGARLRNARLREAELNGAMLSDADLSRAACSGTVLASVDLSQTIGLSSARHDGPSTIGLDTFFLSKGKIPLVFLRGAGIPDAFIQYAASLTRTACEFYSCFISYSHADKPFARRLHDALQGRGIRCWLDEHQLLPGDPIYDSIDRGIRLWDKVLLCCSETALTSWWVDNEIQITLAKEQQLAKERGHKVHAL